MNQYQRIFNILIEKSISAMHRAGEFEDDDNPLTKRAREKQERSLERAEASIARANKAAGYDDLGNPGESATASDRRKRMGRPTANLKGIRKAPSREAAAASGRHLLRVPRPLEGDEETHRTAAVIARREKFRRAIKKPTPKKEVRRNIYGREI